MNFSLIESVGGRNDFSGGINDEKFSLMRPLPNEHGGFARREGQEFFIIQLPEAIAKRAGLDDHQRGRGRAYHFHQAG